ncbi:MAG: hypothetical protein ACI9W7_000160 [Porticoccaceae bacterium]|jgi:hypothetical protein|tara:strand:- start:1461 stop:2585 length:1125 start_codon:yes stop_codon:yes gene_type:complete
MSIKQNGGVFGRNPTFNDVTIEGDLIINGEVFTGLDFQGSWNASTNTPALASGTGTNGEFYIVSVAGTTNLDGITNWGIGDWALFNGTVWQRVEGGADGNFDDLTANTLVIDGQATFNASGADADFRVDADTDTHALFVQGSDGFVGVGNSAPSARLEVGAGVSSETLKVNAGAGWADVRLHSSASNGGSVYFNDGADAGQIFYYHVADYMSFKTASTEAMRIDASQNLSISTGNLVIGTSGKGIDFSATAGTGTSELLDDYEEGTWTPAVTGNTGTATTFSLSGKYTKVGRAVTIQAIVGATNGTFITDGGTKITGLPFTVLSATNCACPAVNQSTGGAIQTGVFNGANTTIQPMFFTAANGNNICFTGTYFT